MVYPALLPLMRTPQLPVVDWTDAPRQFKWTRPFRRKTKSGLCACAITFQTQSTKCCLVTINKINYYFILFIYSFHIITNKCTINITTGTRGSTTSRKVAGSISDGVTGIFHWHNSSGRTMALGLTRPLTEMSTRNISWGYKGGRCVGLTILSPLCAECLKILEPQIPGNFRACLGL
jgi:hypothetical protein